MTSYATTADPVACFGSAPTQHPLQRLMRAEDVAGGTFTEGKLWKRTSRPTVLPRVSTTPTTMARAPVAQASVATMTTDVAVPHVVVSSTARVPPIHAQATRVVALAQRADKQLQRSDKQSARDRQRWHQIIDYHRGRAREAKGRRPICPHVVAPTVTP
jgi:hypothetical protein